jgi:hypothetical protein
MQGALGEPVGVKRTGKNLRPLKHGISTLKRILSRASHFCPFSWLRKIRSGTLALSSLSLYPYHFPTLGLFFYPEDGGSTFLRNVNKYTLDFMASRPRR